MEIYSYKTTESNVYPAYFAIGPKLFILKRRKPALLPLFHPIMEKLGFKDSNNIGMGELNGEQVEIWEKANGECIALITDREYIGVFRKVKSAGCYSYFTESFNTFVAY